MFRLTLKKIWKNKWITACLFLGCFLIIAIAASIPSYTSGILEKLLLRDLRSIQAEDNVYPGSYSFEELFGHSEKDESASYEKYQELAKAANSINQKDALQALDNRKTINSTSMGPFLVFPQHYVFDDDIVIKTTDALTARFEVRSINDIKDQINILSGRMYEKGLQEDGTYEIIISNQASQFYKLTVNNTYESILGVRPFGTRTKYKFKVVGVFEMKDSTSPFWYDGFASYERCGLIDEETLMTMVENDKQLMYKASFTTLFDYENISSAQVPDLIEAFVQSVNEIPQGTKDSIPCYTQLKTFESRESQLMILTILLDIPLLVILIFYIYMVSKLIVGYDENEISVLKSRGAKRAQIMLMYLYECLILSGAAFILAVPFGMLISSMIGYSNGFLQFVNRTKINISLSPAILVYSLIGVVIFVLATLIPIFFASKKNILNHKQERSANPKTPIWQKVFLDVLLIGISLYGLYLYQDAQKVALLLEDKAYKSANPLIFLMSSIFILGCCLFVIRIYPWLVKLIHWVGKRFWTASIHVSMINLSRNKAMGKTIVLFLSFTISVGIFSAATARTINRNEEDKINYKNGTDVVLTQHWIPTGTRLVETASKDGVPSNFAERPYYDSPPPFDVFSNVKGVESYTKVYTNKLSNTVIANGAVRGSTIMAIDPATFAETAWSRDNLLPNHINTYLNSLAETPNGCLVSSKMAEKQGLKIGDPITIKIESVKVEKTEFLPATVCGIVDYFPTFNDQIKVDTREGDSVLPSLVVVNYNYLFRYYAMEIYDVWVKRDMSVSTEDFIQSMSDNKIEIVSMTNSKEEIIQDVKNDSIVQGMNGTLSLSFIISMIITATGFLIYWIVDIKSRLLQFSVLRSMGVSKRSLYGMLAFEQLITASFAILTGTIIGGLTSTLFIEAVGMYMDLSSQVPPFQVLIYLSDYIKIYSVILILILLCLWVIFTIVSRLNIASTLKLGED